MPLMNLLGRPDGLPAQITFHVRGGEFVVTLGRMRRRRAPAGAGSGAPGRQTAARAAADAHQPRTARDPGPRAGARIPSTPRIGRRAGPVHVERLAKGGAAT